MMVDPIARPFGKFHRAICFPARKKKEREREIWISVPSKAFHKESWRFLTLCLKR